MVQSEAPADTVTWAQQVPADEVDPVLLEYHAAHEVWERLREQTPKSMTDETVTAAGTLCHGLGGKVDWGRIGDGNTRQIAPPKSPLKRAWGIAKVVVVVVVSLAPIGGMAAFLTGGTAYGGPGRGITTQEWDVNVQIMVSTICFWMACLAPVFFFASWARSGRRRDGSPAVLLFLIVPAVVSLIALNARDVDITDTSLRSPSLPVWLVIGLSVLAALLAVVFSRGDNEKQQRLVLVRERKPDQIAKGVRNLPDEVREEVLAARNQAITTLAGRGLISEETAAAAVEAPLGQLRW